MSDIRSRLIEATFEEVFENGYSGASLSNILTKAKTKKGSMYHHFPSKKQMVLSMIEEKLSFRINNKWESLEKCEENILNTLISVLEDKEAWNLRNGCALGNLLQETLNHDEDFAQALTSILDRWKQLLSNSLIKAIKHGELQEDINVQKISTFIIASIEGALLLAKKYENKDDFDICIEQLVIYLNSLKKIR